ncbi:hypothetical protein V8B55DRAFT_1562605 [Mucor lusitanicus]|uniref:F-box domain-containing protein n=2 Tax=Mucor circinelloides f. lusitanicus TaxID=29924 RepID=A0A168MJ23_MUCCL|nr:hypothetical protein FB192DRAFT_1468188 [Mucor lusitanicus]OAD05017.1 hypothetical protein MUCCIDRAFT_80109 [Mucor lusitanicus CBS 277.49]
MAFTDLPSEISQAILACIDEVQVLAECRLVCRDWNPICEQLMFGKKIFLESQAKVSQLVEHLNKSPSFGKLVKYVVFDFAAESTASALYSKLLSLIFTPNLRVLDGYMPIRNIYKEMVSIASKSSQKFDKLEVIPQGERMATDSSDFKAACLLFKKSLKVVTVTVTDENKPDWRFIGQLGTFENLAHLILTSGTPDLSTLRRIIDNCNQLETLKLIWVDAENPRMTKAAVRNWFYINDKPKKQGKALRLLKVVNCFSPVFVEYLVYKFQHIEKAEIDMNMYQVFISDSVIQVTDGAIHDHHIRVVQALQDTLYYDFLYCTLRNNRLENIIYHAQVADNVIAIRIVNPQKGLVHMRVKKLWYLDV